MLELVTDGTEAAGDYLEAKRDIFLFTSTHCLPHIIRMSQCVNSANLAKHMDYFRDHLVGMSPRLPEIYSIYRLFAHEIISLVDNEAVLNTQAFDDFLEAHFLPHVKSLYATTVKVHTNLEDIMKLLVQAIESNERNEADLRTWMRPTVVAKDKTVFIAFVLPKALKEVKDAGLTPPTE
ncbi:Hypothetical predicted protein, partial [Paramuricea clavata]